MKTIAIRKLRQKIASDTPAFGLWVTLESPSITEMAVALGLDWVVIDADISTGITSSNTCARPSALVRIAELNSGPVRDPAEKISGRWRLDTSFDGRERTQPDGVLYHLTGCGGNPELHSPEQTDNLQTWQPFTVKYHASLHQFTELEINDRKLTLRQISLNGDELDRFILTKPQAKSSAHLEN